MSAYRYDSEGNLREFWDDDTRTYTQYDENGNVVETRPYTEQENAAADAALEQNTVSDNRDELITRAERAIQRNATFLANQSPTQAQVLAQVRVLTRQNNALLRLATGDLLDISDTE